MYMTLIIIIEGFLERSHVKIVYKSSGYINSDIQMIVNFYYTWYFLKLNIHFFVDL